MRKSYIPLVALLIHTVALAEDAKQTEPERRSLVTASLGQSVPTTAGGVSSFVLAARVGTQLGQDSWAKGHIGLVLGTTSISTSLSGLTEVDTATYILTEYLARQMFGTGLYFGARAGLAILNSNVTGGSVNVNGTATAFSYAPAIGYEIPVSSQMDINLDVSWLTRSATTMVIPALGTLNAATSQGVILLAGLNYHF